MAKKMARKKKVPPGTYNVSMVEDVVVTTEGLLEITFSIDDGDFAGRTITARIPPIVEEEEDEISLTEEKLLEDIKGDLGMETRASLTDIYNRVMDVEIDESDVEWDPDRE